MTAVGIATFMGLCTFAVIARAAPADQKEAPSFVSSHDGAFGFVAPAGWLVQQSEERPTVVTVSKGNEKLALTFYVSQPGKWTVETLMAAQSEATRRVIGDLVATTIKREIKARGGPGALWAYGISEESGIVPFPFAGCVIIKAGGVGVNGVAFKRETLDVAEGILLSVQALDASK